MTELSGLQRDKPASLAVVSACVGQDVSRHTVVCMHLGCCLLSLPAARFTVAKIFAAEDRRKQVEGTGLKES